MVKPTFKVGVVLKPTLRVGLRLGPTLRVGLGWGPTLLVASNFRMCPRRQRVCPQRKTAKYQPSDGDKGLVSVVLQTHITTDYNKAGYTFFFIRTPFIRTSRLKSQKK